MDKLIVQLTKEIKMDVANGELHIEIVDDSYCLTYHNKIFKGSPFKVPTQFSTEFTVQQILKSDELASFLKRFD